MKNPEYHTLREKYGLDPFVQGDGYSYTLSQVRTFPPGSGILEPEEQNVLDAYDKLAEQLRTEEGRV